MNWQQFKRIVEKAGVQDSDIVAFIDVDHPKTELNVIRTKLSGAQTLAKVEISDYAC